MSVYQVFIERNSLDLGTLYWNGSFEETRELARMIASKREADAFRIVEVASRMEVWSEHYLTPAKEPTPRLN